MKKIAANMESSHVKENFILHYTESVSTFYSLNVWRMEYFTHA